MTGRGAGNVVSWAVWIALADDVTTLQRVGQVAQAFASILTGLIAVLGVPLALRQVVNLQREMRRYETEARRRLEAETNLNISAQYSLTRPTHAAAPAHATSAASRASASLMSAQPSPAAEPGKRVLRFDLTLENVGEGSVDVLACLVAARELAQYGEGVVSGGRDAQWDDLTPHYWGDDPERSLSPGLSTTKHIVYAQDALARIKAKSHKTLARIDQVRRESTSGDDIYLLYRVFVVARRSARSIEDVNRWADLQRALLNVNAPAFRAAAGETDPLGHVATPDGWRLFLHHYSMLADPKLPHLRLAADREELALSDPVARQAAADRHAAELRAYCETHLVPVWRLFREDGARARALGGFDALLTEKSVRLRQRDLERHFPWSEQELWTEYFYATLREEQ